MILVLGGTGLVGGAVLRRLAARGLPVRALVRRPDPELGLLGTGTNSSTVEVVLGDAADTDSLRRAMREVQQVFLVMANGPAQQHHETAVIRAASAAGVEHLVKVSAPYVEPDSSVAIARMHHAIEQEVLDAGFRSGMQHTFLRPYAFMQNLLNNAPTIRMAGFFTGITGDARMNMVDVDDLARVAEVALATDRTRGRALVLTGAETVSYPEVADRLTALGRPTRYLDMQPAEFAHGLQRAAVPAWAVEHLLEIQAHVLTCPETPTDTVQKVTGRAPGSLEAFLAEHVAAFSRPLGLRERLIAVPLRRSGRQRVAAGLQPVGRP